MTQPLAHIPMLPREIVDYVADAIIHESLRQDELARAGKFGGTHIMPGGTDLQRLAVLAEEFGEVSIEVCNGITVEEHVRRENLRTELIQVAAVALSWVAAIDDGREP